MYTALFIALITSIFMYYSNINKSYTIIQVSVYLNKWKYFLMLYSAI